MASIFNALHIGYSGLNAAQVGINTTGHNIANAETDGYTRQRVIATNATPIAANPGQVGNGVEIQTIKRVFDNFVFDRYTDTYAKKEYSDFEKTNLEQLSTYFPEIDEVGIKADLQEYYNMWQTFADNPDNGAIKLALTKQAEILSNHIHATKAQVTEQQSQLNNQIEVNINEVNSLAEKLADLNKSIDTAESGKLYDANDLRDKRNTIERDLARLIGAQANYGQIESNIQIDTSSNMKTGSYSVSINGFNIVDGNSYHPLHVSNDKNASGFYEISYERQDGVLIPMEENINGGKLGAILDLRGGTIDSTSGVPKDGILQNTIAQLDGFAAGLIESTNNLYASSATTRMDSNTLNLSPTDALLSSNFNIKEGSFNLVIYDIDGNKVSSRAIDINVATTMTGTSGSNSIEGQMIQQLDDNDDGNANNDIDDYLRFNWATFASGENAVEFTLDPLKESQGYTFAIEDSLSDDKFASGTNFAGALGMSRFFDGKDASDININAALKANPTAVRAGYTPIAGDSRLALDMVQQQYENLDFKVGPTSYETSAYEMFDIIATDVGIATNSAISRNETISTQFNAVEMEYFSVSKVSIDEEMTNLIKYQTSYGAAAKVITTIDQMMQTLLGIKQ
ncbi:MAG: flagellar hook-associated protein 1 FlgK [Sulfurimonas sp.]|jgi:flagellar hook-associated protein 1 FlgK|uniref:flagellar hook-associated protein FlgK n=1 Tax=Sulfurimonas sp. TaxID=2022749 RepID=UPI0039E56219